MDGTLDQGPFGGPLKGSIRVCIVLLEWAGRQGTFVGASFGPSLSLRFRV